MRIWVWLGEVGSGRTEAWDEDGDLCEEKEAGRRKCRGIAVGEGMVRVVLGSVVVVMVYWSESLRVRVWSGVEGRMLGEVCS